MSDLEALKTKVMAPSVKQALKAKAASKNFEQSVTQSEQEEKDAARKKQTVEAVESKQARRKQAEGDRAGIKVPLISY